MNPSIDRELVLELRHTGERLALRRERTSDGVEQLHISGTLPPHRPGPPLHIHKFEDESGTVVSGILSATLDGRTLTFGTGESARFPTGSAHRWWNDGDETLVFAGVARPVTDLDRFLQAMFEVLNAGKPHRPSLIYIAHVLHRHRKTQTAFVMPRLAQIVLFPIVILVGSMLGKYRGTDWPGCPERCLGAPGSPASDSTAPA